MPTQGDHRARFYEDYHKVAEEYDKEFLKKHDEDLNTTLIFVSSLPVSDEYVLTMGTGRSILCSHICVYHSGGFPTSTRSKRRDRRPPPSSHLQDR